MEKAKKRNEARSISVRSANAGNYSLAALSRKRDRLWSVCGQSQIFRILLTRIF